MKPYWTDRKESTLNYRFGAYELKVRYFENCDSAQVSMYSYGDRLPLIWSQTMKDQQANAAIEIFKKIGYFDLVTTA